MKQRILLFTLSIGLGYLALSSYKAGPAASAGDRTGRLGLTCAASGCHTSSGGATTCAIEVRKKSAGMSSTVVTQYIADTMYTVTLTGTNSTLPKFGFQLCAATGTGAAGTFSNLPAKTHTATVSGFPVLEQSDTIAKTGSNYTVTFDWKAPSNTSVTFYGVINAVNGTGNENGDAVSAPASVTLQNAASVGGLDNNTNFTAYPNPFTNALSLKLEHVPQGNYNISTFDLRGKKIAEQQINVSSSTVDQPLRTDRWASGYYIIQIEKDGNSQMIPVIKK